jgi:HlyD family secretion protein
VWRFAKNRRRVAGAVLVIAAAAALYAAAYPTSTIDSIRVRRDVLHFRVSVEGEIKAVHSMDIGPPVVGDVWDYKISFLAPEGALVKKGDPIVGFDASTLQRLLEQKRAEYAEAAKKLERKADERANQGYDLELQLAEAVSRLSKARLKAAVPEDLRMRNEVRQTAIELAGAEAVVTNLKKRIAALDHSQEAALRELAGQRDRAHGRVSELEDAVARMMVRAPQDGIVVYVTERGQQNKIKLGDSTWFGGKVMTLADLGAMRAEGEVDEADAGAVAVGQPVTLHLEALPDHDVKGRVARIGHAMHRKSAEVPAPVLSVQISLNDGDAALRPAMRFRGHVETGQSETTLVVPRESVFPGPSGPIVWLRGWRGFVPQRIALGRADDAHVEVVSGLREGHEVAAADPSLEVRR